MLSTEQGLGSQWGGEGRGAGLAEGLGSTRQAPLFRPSVLGGGWGPLPWGLFF